MLKLKLQILWPPDAKSWLIWKDPDAGKYREQEEKGTTEDELVGWHHRLNGHGFGWIPGVGDGQGVLACFGSWDHWVGHKWETELNWSSITFQLSLNLIKIDGKIKIPFGKLLHGLKTSVLWRQLLCPFYKCKHLRVLEDPFHYDWVPSTLAMYPERAKPNMWKL